MDLEDAARAACGVVAAGIFRRYLKAGIAYIAVPCQAGLFCSQLGWHRGLTPRPYYLGRGFFCICTHIEKEEVQYDEQ